MKNLTVRRAKTDELSTIQSVAREIISTRYPAFLGEDAVNAFLESGQSDQEFVANQNNIFVLLEGDEIRGFSICFDDFIHLMMTKLEFQQKGYGSFLLNWCETAIKARGYDIGRLETFASNVQAVEFYRKNGWIEAGREDEDAGVFARIRFEKAV